MNSYYFFDINLVVDLIQSLASIAVIIDAIEIIVERHQYSSRGIYNFETLRIYRKWMMNKWIAPIYNILFNYPNYIFLAFIQLVVSILMVSHLFANLSLWFIIIILLILLLSHLRNQYGLDGADQLQVIVFASLVAFYITTDPIIQKFSIFFVCFQSLLAYFIAGLAKLISPIWRGGMAITNIINTESYGNKVLAQLLIKKPLLSKMMCWGVIILESLCPILIFSGMQTTIIFIICGTIFHLSIAIFMRLNSFFWTFISTYPALLFFDAQFQNYL